MDHHKIQIKLPSDINHRILGVLLSRSSRDARSSPPTPLVIDWQHDWPREFFFRRVQITTRRDEKHTAGGVNCPHVTDPLNYLFI
jgi:hypothetical protein